MYILVESFLDEEWYDDNENLLTPEQMEMFRAALELEFPVEIDQYWDQELTPVMKKKADKWLADSQKHIIASLGFKPHFYYEEE